MHKLGLTKTNSMQSKVRHIVHIMFENRSIDNVLGWLYAAKDNQPPNMIVVGAGGDPGKPFYRGLEKDRYFTLEKKGNRHYATPVPDNNRMDVPNRDPNEEYQFVNNQCFEVTQGNPPQGKEANMGGFYKDFEKGESDDGEIMQAYTPRDLPVINGLAANYCVCDGWFASVPTQTNCNRAFAGTGNSIGVNANSSKPKEKQAWVNNNFRIAEMELTFTENTVWNVLSDNGYDSTEDWMIFYSEKWLPVFGEYCYTRDLFDQLKPDRFDDHFVHIEKFFSLAQEGQLPYYSFLEPEWGLKADGIGPNGNDYHPPYNVKEGEELLNKIYSALTDNRNAWDSTLFVVTFDEHGGTYDHIPTSLGATPPWGNGPPPYPCERDFDFKRFGVRVPAIFASPLVYPNTVFRMADGLTPFDHTSLIATILNWKGIPKQRWGLGERVLNAPLLDPIFVSGKARADVPKFTPRKVPQPKANRVPANDLQRQIAERMLGHAARIHGTPQKQVLALHRKHTKHTKSVAGLAQGLQRALKAMEAKPAKKSRK